MSEPAAAVFCDAVDCQQELFDPSELPAGRELLLPAEAQAHRFTGEVVARNREKYAAIIGALGEGLGVRQIARAFKVSHHTVEVIREREASLVATRKEAFGRRLFNVASMALERLEEALEKDEIPKGQLAVTTGILVDKSIAWSGQSAPRVEMRLELSVERVKGMFASLAGLDATATSNSGPAAKVIDIPDLCAPVGVFDVALATPGPVEISAGSSPESESVNSEVKAQ